MILKRRVIGILAFVMITLLAFAVACGSTDSDDELTEEKSMIIFNSLLR